MNSGFRSRLTALVRKEFRQLLRDTSNMAIGIVLPIVLILIFGYGLSLDVRNAPIAVVMEDSSPTAHDAVAGFSLSPSFAPLPVASMHEAEALMRDRRVDAIVRIPATFTRDFAAGAAAVQIIVHGAEANRASIIRGAPLSIGSCAYST